MALAREYLPEKLAGKRTFKVDAKRSDKRFPMTSPEICRQRMIERDSDRDTWKLENWDEYISKVNFDTPELLDDPNVVDKFLKFYNSSNEEFEESMERITKILLEE